MSATMAARWTVILKVVLSLRHESIAFGSLERARSFAARCNRPMWIVMGDVDPDSDQATAWVVCPADAAKLERAGYELA